MNVCVKAKKTNRKLLILIVIFSLGCVIVFQAGNKKSSCPKIRLHQPRQLKGPAPYGRPRCMDAPIDVVYTWVNGSDPEHVKLRNGFDPKTKGFDNSKVRYNDWGTLKYSIRSVRMNAAWVRNIYIVTTGQVPEWLDTTQEGIQVISHSDIFEIIKDLPTFNSDAIEMHIHRIHGLSDKFIYMNDDFFLGQPMTKVDFCYDNYGQNLYSSFTISHCQDGCPIEWVGDGYCHSACNVSGCAFDKGDCDAENAHVYDKKSYTYDNLWWQSLAYLAGILNEAYGYRERTYYMHAALFMDKLIFQELTVKFKDLVAYTSSQKFRTSQDIEVPFLYNNFIVEEFQKMKRNGQLESERYQIYEYQEANEHCSGFDFIGLGSDLKKMRKWFNGKDEFGKFGCMNDNTDDINDKDAVILKSYVIEFLEKLFPMKSIFEK